MKLIFAQGNPGSQYAKNRHNVGFMAVDTYADTHSASFTAKTKFHSEIAELNIAGEKVLLIKPTTFYNETGQSLRAIMDFYKVDTQDVLVIHDELVLPFGKIRIRHNGRDAGNNGIKSLNAHIGENYARLRVGVYNELRDRMHDADFVLGNFSSDEQEALQKYVLPKIVQLLDTFIAAGLSDDSFSTLPNVEQKN